MSCPADTTVDSLVRPPPSRLGVAELALFLDVDGTLLDIAPTPDAVVVDPSLVQLLRALVLRTQGAVAFVSGRSIATLDQLFQPLLLPAAGLHGFERRSADASYCRRPPPPGELLASARSALRSLVSQHPGLLLEDKQFALAVHYRAAVHLESLVMNEVERLAQSLGPAFKMQRGRCVAELRPGGADKAAAIAEFMREAPFIGRRPVCLGDDLTDECAFEWVNAAGGLSLSVGAGPHSAATANVPSVAAARQWLRQLIERPK